MSSPAASTDTKSAPAAVMAAADGTAATVTPMAGGGSAIVPLPLGGGKRRSRKLSKKVLKMLKKMGPAKVAKMVKKGGDDTGMGMGDEGAVGGRRRRSGKKTRRYSRRR